MILDFDTCALDTSKQELWRDGELVAVEPQVLKVIEYLLRNAERVVTKIELLDEVWGDRFVSESALTSRIKLARRACGDNGRDQRILKTVHSRGYRLVTPVTSRGPEPTTTPSISASTTPSGSTPPAVSARQVRRQSTTLFGRQDELEALDDLLDQAASGRRQHVFVCGVLGSGKSTMVAEFLERQDDLEQFAVARGQCIRARGGVEPYFGLLGALGNLAGVDPDLVSSTLERVAPIWLAQMPSLVDAETMERLERRLIGSQPSQMLRAGVEAFSALAHVRPLILVLEDLHLADDCTLDVIEVLLQRGDQCPFLLVATCRPDVPSLRSVIEPPVAMGQATMIELDPLDRASIAELVADRAGIDRTDGIPDDLIAVIERLSGGVPLFAGEIVGSWLCNELIRVNDQVIEATEDLAVLESTIPIVLPPLVERDLLVLDENDMTLLEACAVAGESFDAASVAAGLGRPLAETERSLALLSGNLGLTGATGAASWPDGTISASYQFTQGLFRQVIYDRTSASVRATIHGRVGAALEAGHGDQAVRIAPVLADHFTQAGDQIRSVLHLAAAGETAHARGATVAAESVLSGALDTLAGLAESPERDAAELRVRMAYGSVLIATRGWFDSSVSDNYERALKLSDDRPPGVDASASRYSLATVSELQGKFERTEALLTPLLAAENEGHLAIEAHELVACSMFHQGAFEPSLHNSTMVLEGWDEDAYSVLMARIAEHPASSCNAWSSLALWALGRTDESLAHAERAVELGEQNPYALSTAVQQRAMLHQLRHDIDESIEWAERCHAIGAEQSNPMRLIQADIYKGWAYGASDRADEGAELIADGLARFRHEGATLNEAYYLGMYADALLHRDEPAAARAALSEAVASTTSRNYFYEVELARLTALAHAADGGTGVVRTVRDEFDRAREIAVRQGSPTLELRVLNDRWEFEIGHGDPQPWREAALSSQARFADQQPTPDTRRTQELAER